jgi:hypothetical protein
MAFKHWAATSLAASVFVVRCIRTNRDVVDALAVAQMQSGVLEETVTTLAPKAHRQICENRERDAEEKAGLVEAAGTRRRYPCLPLWVLHHPACRCRLRSCR